mmetsp:Transcript_66687/g.168179  ORF Transcript_66687/g.168179 Transcript_66687/m.168179 type:complete len:211 (+) Transcript_66687:1320-1952(+)
MMVRGGGALRGGMSNRRKVQQGTVINESLLAVSTRPLWRRRQRMRRRCLRHHRAAEAGGETQKNCQLRASPRIDGDRRRTQVAVIALGLEATEDQEECAPPVAMAALLVGVAAVPLSPCLDVFRAPLLNPGGESRSRRRMSWQRSRLMSRLYPTDGVETDGRGQRSVAMTTRTPTIADSAEHATGRLRPCLWRASDVARKSKRTPTRWTN